MDSPIPKIFHFVFGLKPQDRPFHLLYYLCLESCLRVNRPEHVYFYYHHEPHGRYWDLIKEKLVHVRVGPVPLVANYRYRDKAVQHYRYAHHSDFIRIEKLVDHGGVYADMDTIFVNPLPERLFAQPFVLGREQDFPWEASGKEQPSLCNALIMSRQGAEFGRLWLNGMADAFDGAWSSHSGLLPQRLSEERPELIHIEPPRSFYKHMYTPEGVQTLFEGCDPDFEGVYSMHLWHHLWSAWWRRDYTRFHEGKLTSDRIRHVDTTYNLVARRFLPEERTQRPAGHVAPGHQSRPPGRKHPGATVRLTDKLLTRFGLWLLSRGEDLHEWRMMFVRVRRRWLFRNFRVENQFEKNCVLAGVLYMDEYGVAGQSFAPSDVIVDVGAHIGAFSYLCHLRGSRSIHCFEPARRNFKLLERNLRSLAGVHALNAAVWRSDGDKAPKLVLSGPIGDNTGANSVLAAGRVVDFDTQTIDREPSPEAHPVASVPLDDILERFERVKLLKLDCEGSEFPILLTSRLLHKVERIVGEIHEVTEEWMEFLDPQCRLEGRRAYRKEALVEKLESVGFAVTTSRGPRHFWWFDARRI